MKINRNNYESFFVDYLEGKLDEKLGDLATLEDQYAHDGSKGRKLGEYDFIGDVEHDCVVDAGEEDLGWSLI